MINKNLILDFFLTLSRTEYALKSAKYFQDNGNGAQPDWNKFSGELTQIFDMEVAENLKEASLYYLDKPPQKQIIENGRLSWSPALPNNSSDIEKLLILVRRVRNNLFHGGKSNPQDNHEAERNTLLLRFGVIILKEAVRLNEQVQREYDKAAI